MKSLIYHGLEHLTLEEIPLPKLEAREVLIKVEAVGICGSELEGYIGHSSIRVPPLVMGHEFCGRISQIAEGVSGLKLGDKVVVNPLISCGSCDRCSSGRPNICRSRAIIGIHRPGAFAEYVTAPSSNVYNVPAEMNPFLASLAEPLAVCIHGIKLGLQSFESLVIFGAGPIGLLTLQTALCLGAPQVLVVDRLPERLAFAERLGASISSPEQLKEQYSKIFDNKGVDTIVDCVGVQATREQALQLINPGGKIIMVGLGHDQSTLQMNHLVRQEVSIIGSYTYSSSDFEQAVHLLIQGNINTDNWTSIRGLSEGTSAFHELAKGTSKFSKILLDPSY